MENSRNKQFISFKLCTESCDELSLRLAPSHPVQNSSLCPGPPHCICSPPVSHLMAISVIRSTVAVSQSCVQEPLFYLIMVPKCKSNDAGNSDILTERNLRIKLCHQYVCIYRKKHSIYRAQYYPWFQASTGLGMHPPNG